MKLRTKAVLGIGILEVTLVGFLLYLMLSYIQDTNYRSLEQRSASTVSLFAVSVESALISSDLATLDSVAKAVVDQQGVVYAQIRGKNGELLVSVGDSARVVSDVGSTESSIIHTTARVGSSDNYFGEVEVGLSSSGIKLLVADARRWGLSVISLELALAALFSLLLSLYLTKKLNRLTLSAQRIAAGDLDTPIQVEGDDEVYQLAASFETMRSQVSRAHKELSIELEREKLAVTTGYGYKWTVDIERRLIQPDSSLAQWHAQGWQATQWYPLNELVQLVPAEHRAAVSAEIERAIESAAKNPEFVLTVMHPIERRDIGETIWVKVFGKVVFDQGRALLVGMSLDVTELVEKQLEVQSQIDKFEGLAAQASISFWRLNLADESLTYSQSVAERWGFEPHGSVPYSRFEDAISEKLAAVNRASIRRVLETSRVHEEIVRLVRGETAGRWARLQYWPVLDDSGRVVAIDFANTDVHELIEARVQLEGTLQRQKELLTIISHEMRTPVSTVHMLATDSSQSEAARLRGIDGAARDLLETLDEMRLVAAPARAFEAEFTLGDPAQLIARAVAALQHMVDLKGFSIDLKRVNHEAVQLEHNAQAVRQMVINLVKNALEHSGGKQIGLALEYLPSIHSPERMRVSVEDDGVGIDKEELQNLLTSSKSDGAFHSGYGLGLFIIRQLCERLGGSLSYTGSALGGAGFTFELPVKAQRADVAVVETRPVELKKPLDNLRVLYAEDDKTLRMLSEKMLVTRGAQVSSFDNGKLALEAYADGRFDLVLTDLMMPEMDGRELTEQLRERGCTLPIIAITAAVIGDETQALYDAGVDIVLAKPLKLDALAEAYKSIEPST